MQRAPVLNWVIHLAMLAAATYLFYVTNSQGLLLTADSGYYSTVALALSADQGFSHHGRYWTVFPPLYPLVLSLPGGIWPPIRFAVLLHSGLFGFLTFAVSVHQGHQGTWRLAISLLLPLLLMISPVFGVGSYIWTELLYIFLTTLMFFIIWSHRLRSSTTWLILLGLVTCLAPVTRYIGMVNIVTATVCLVFVFSGRWWIRLLKCGAFGVITAVPLVIWCIRNYSIDGTFFGVRPPRYTPISVNLHATWVTFCSWFDTIADGHINLIWIALPIFLYVTLKVWASLPWGKCASIVLFVTMYLGFLNISASKHVHDPIDTRLLIPIYVPLLLLLSIVVTTAMSTATRTTRVLAVAMITIFAFSNIHNYGKMLYNISEHRQDLICRYNSFPPPSANCQPR